MAKTITARVELTPAAKAKMDSIADQRGMTQYLCLSRLVEWFAKQDSKTQHAAMGHYPPEIMAELAKIIKAKAENAVK